MEMVPRTVIVRVIIVVFVALVVGDHLLVGPEEERPLRGRSRVRLPTQLFVVSPTTTTATTTARR
jgi:hypothetical protein